MSPKSEGVCPIRVVHRVINRGLSRMAWDQGRRHSLFLITQYVVWTLTATAMLESLGVHISVLIAGSAAILVGLGLGVQQIFRDIVSGIFLLFEGTVEVGDVLQIDGKVVRVEEISLRTSRLLTREGNALIVPNSRFITESVFNWTHHSDAPSQFQIPVFVGREADEEQVREMLLKAASEHPAILAQPAPNARLSEMREEGALLFTLVVWSQTKFEMESVLSEIRYAIRRQLREQGVPLPTP